MTQSDITAISTALSGKTALITGGGVRLGRAAALGLASHGADLVLHYNTSGAGALDAAGTISKLGCKAWCIRADLGNAAAAEALLDSAISKAGAIDILINNASIFPKNRLTDFSADDLSQNIQINAMAPLLLARSFASQQREGVIINFLDTRITEYDRNHAAYHLSKRMLYSMTKMMALEFAPRLRVNAVAPGLILPPPGADEGYLERLAEAIPLKRSGNPNDVIEAVLFLVRSSFITGQVLFIDGGQHLNGSVYS